MMAVCNRCNNEFKVSIFKSMFRKDILCEDCQRIDAANKFVKECNIATYENRVNEYQKAQYMSSDDENSLQILKEYLDLNDSDVDHKRIDIETLKRITWIRNGRLPIIQSGIQLKKSEKCHCAASVNLVETKTRTRREGGVPGRSVRIGRGVSYRIPGIKGRPVHYTYDEVTDEGKLYITNSRIIFIGTKKTVTYSNIRVLILKNYSNAIEIKKDNQQKSKHFTFNNRSELTEVQLILVQLFKQ
jgi:hypothetical protein